MSERKTQADPMEPLEEMDHNQHNSPDPAPPSELSRGTYPRTTRVAEPLKPEQIAQRMAEIASDGASGDAAEYPSGDPGDATANSGGASGDPAQSFGEVSSKDADEDARDAGNAENAEGTGNAENAEDAKGAEDTEDTEGTEDAENAEDAEDVEEGGDAEDAEDSEDAVDAEDAEDAEEPAFAKEPAKKETQPRASGVAAARSAKHFKRSRKHRKRNRILKVFLALLLVAAFFTVANMEAFQITEIAVIGNKTVSDKKIRKLSHIRKGDSIFFVNPLLASSRIKKNYYIEDVNIDRHLPGTVEIIVKEREAAAQFVMRNAKNKKRYVCVDQDGMVIGISKKQKDVTLVINVSVLEAEKGSQLKVDDKGVYHRALELIQAAKDGDMYFKRIFIKGSLVHAYIYDDLMVSGRLPNVMESLKNGTLKSVVYSLYQDDVTEGTINIGDNNYCSFTP